MELEEALKKRLNYYEREFNSLSVASDHKSELWMDKNFLDKFKSSQFLSEALRKMLNRYFDGEKRDQTLERLKGTSLTAVLCQDIIFSEKSEKSEDMFFTGLFARRREIINLMQTDRKAYDGNATSKILVDWIGLLEGVLAEMAGQETLIFEKTNNAEVVVAIQEVMSVDQLNKIISFYGSRLVGFVTDHATTATHWVAISPKPVLVLEPDTLKKGGFNEKFPRIFVDKQQGKEASPLFFNPSSEQEAQYQIKKERENKFQKSLNKIAPRESHVSFYGNITPSDLRDVLAYRLDGIGLTRTEVDREIERILVEMIRGGKQLKGAKDHSHQGLSDFLLDTFIDRYTSQIREPFLRGRVNTFRTLDVQPDKNEELFVYYQDKPGFDFYRSSLGKEALQVQVASFLTIFAEDILAESERTKLRCVFHR
jgi:hypothetical protein